MGSEKKSNQTYRADGTQKQGIIPLMGHKDNVVISRLKVLGMDKVEMGEMKIEMITGNIGILELILKIIVMKRVIQRILMNWR